MRCTLFVKGLNEAKRSIPITRTERKLLGPKAGSQTRDRPGTFWMLQPLNYGRIPLNVSLSSEIIESCNLTGHLSDVNLVLPMTLFTKSLSHNSVGSVSKNTRVNSTVVG